MGSLLAVYYWNTGKDVLPTTRTNGVETTVPKAVRLDQLVIVDLKVNLGKEVRSAPTLCAKYKGKIIPLNTAHDGRPILMREENSINNN